MYCQECGKESQPGEVICSSCGGALTDAELDLPEVMAFPVAPPGEAPASTVVELGGPAVRMPTAPPAAPALAGPAPGGAAITGPRLEMAVGALSGSYALSQAVTTIGRGDPAAGLKPDVDLSADVAVSRRHAEIRRGADGFRIIDLGSTNGTVVNGKQVSRQVEVPLADGDEIRLGENSVLMVRLS